MTRSKQKWEGCELAIREAVCRVYGSEISQSGTLEQTHSLQNSDIWRFHSVHLTAPLAVKICTSAPGRKSDSAAAKRQYEALVLAWGRMKDDARFTLPKPICLDETNGLFITEWAAGKTLTEILKGGGDNAMKRQASRRAGQWLHHFHCKNRVEDQLLDCGHRVEMLETRFAKATRLPRVIKEARGLLLENSQVLAGTWLHAAYLHGDFKPDNVIVNETSVVSFDVDMRYRSIALFDVAAFMNRVDIILLLSYWKPWSNADSDLIDEFEDGYFGNEKIESLVLGWLRIWNALSMWLERQNSGGSVIVRSANLLLLERLCRRAISYLNSKMSTKYPDRHGVK